jgi:tetratricopeptide (TPR) repeat protein
MADMKVRHILLRGAVCAACVFAAVPAFALSEAEALVQAKAAYKELAAGNFKAAIAGYDIVIASKVLKPDVEINAVLNKALAEQRTGDFKASLADYSVALGNPAISTELRAIALYNRGLTFHQSKDLPHAIEDYTAALMVNPQLPQAFLARGQALRENGQLLFAISDFDRAIAFKHPDPARVHYFAGLTQEQLSRPLEARREYELALNANPALGGAKLRLAALSTVLAGEQTATIAAAPATTSVDVVKPSMPKPVEPGNALLEPASKPVSQPAKAVAKIYVDRIPESTAALTPETVEVVSSTSEITNSVTPAPAITEPDTAEPASGWAVQLVSATTEAGALSSWEKMKKRNSALKSLDVKVVKADLGTKGVFYRVRVLGFDKQSEAATVCKSLKAKGVSCYVSNVGS